MAQKPPPYPATGTSDGLNLASQAMAYMKALRSGASSKPPDLPLDPVPCESVTQPSASRPRMSSSPPNTLPYHRAQQNGKETAQIGIAVSPIPHLFQQSGSHGKSEAEVPRANEQQDTKVPLEDTNSNAGVEPQDEVSSDDLSDMEASDGTESHISVESEDDLDRLDKYAFSYSGQAYHHRAPQHLTGGVILFTKKVTQGTTILQHLASAENEGKSIMCPNLVPHELETKPASRAVECIWVGMLPNPRDSHKRAISGSVKTEPQADAESPAAQGGGDDAAEAQLDDDTSKASKKVKKRAKKGQPIIELEDDQFDIIPHDPKALRVVAKKLNKEVKTWHLYALTASGSSSKLCQGWKVHNEEVFFFKAFRDDTVAGIKKRRHTSDIKIKAVIFPADATPASVPRSSPSVKRLTGRVSAPATMTPGGLPTSGRNEKTSRPVRDGTEDEAPNSGDVLGHDGDDDGSPVGSVENGDASGADNQSTTGFEPKEVGTARLATDQREKTGNPYDDGDEDAYPEHAVSATSPSFKNYLDGMLRELSGMDPDCVTQGEKRKRVAFDTSCDEAANTRRKTGDSSRSNGETRGGREMAGSASFVDQQHTDHLARKLTRMVDELVAKRDVAGLRQCVTMVECIEKRSSPGQASALAPYLSISSKQDTTSRACCGKLREILDLFPDLEDVDVDNYVLYCMITGLRLTGQSIDIGLVEPYVRSFSRLYKQKFGETANHPTKIVKGDLIDMICEARDDAEKMVRKTALNSGSKVWVPHEWVDPRDDAGSIDFD